MSFERPPSTNNGGGDSNEPNHPNFTARNGVLMNSNGGFYQHRKSYGMDTKLFVAMRYLEHNARLGGSRPVLTEVTAECRAGRDFVSNIEGELMENDRVLICGISKRSLPVRFSITDATVNADLFLLEIESAIA